MDGDGGSEGSARKHALGYAGREGFDEVRAFTLDDGQGVGCDVGVGNRAFDRVGGGGLHLHLDVDDERLRAPLFLGEHSVRAVPPHSLDADSVAHG